MKKTSTILLLIIITTFTYAQSGRSDMTKLDSLNELEWKLSFSDSFKSNWQKNWFLDGLEANLSHTANGLDFWAGKQAFNDSSHAVLWTKKTFSGNLKIEYDYTRLDSSIRFVNIIYIQATGSSKVPFDADITKWSHLREVPAMKMYFKHMNTYHISYAAFDIKNTIPGNDYVRLRRYMPDQNGLKGTEVPPSFENTGLFTPGILHHITIFKTGNQVVMHVKNKEKEVFYEWVNSDLPLIFEGKIGLRHMHTRGSRYANFQVSELKVDTFICPGY